MAEARAQNTYRVTDRLEAGGMAEVFRGESTSVAGFKKQVAIKRVLSHLASNEKFIRMFLDEARLSARLTHTNIVQVFDIGHVENTYFIVMEFIDGVNLKHVIEHLRARKHPFPCNVAVHITAKVCEGLFYAHEITDSDGKLLGTSSTATSPPQRAHLARSGEVKIVDFGLAKAAVSVEKTEPGVVKGKFSLPRARDRDGRGGGRAGRHLRRGHHALGDARGA
jgi:serine/threonine protein kinase